MRAALLSWAQSQHGIEHAFGIIGSAMMPVSDLFPRAGITFWDCAHESNAALIADGYSRVTGKMAMVDEGLFRGHPHGALSHPGFAKSL
jgi:thiamine pyrophosphate-dependent acetolactate synthase large subunit-like protein